MDASRTETTRYMAASAFLPGAWFRRRVLEHVEPRPIAHAPELGLDLDLVVDTCRYADRAEAKYDAIRIGLSILFLLVAGLGPLPERRPAAILFLFFLFLGSIFVVRFYQIGEELSLLDTFFRRESYNPDAIARLVRGRPRGKTGAAGSSGPQNLVVYGGFEPFVGSGKSIGDWTFDVDVSQAKQELGKKAEVVPFQIEELYDRIDRAVAQLDIPGTEVRDVLYVRGQDIRNHGWVLPDLYGRPVSRADSRLVRRVMGLSGLRFRHYKCIQIHDWASELVVSHYLRLSRRGIHSLFVEVSRYVLTPLHPNLRLVDELLEDQWRQLALLVVTELRQTPATALRSWTRTVGRARDAVDRMLGREERRFRQQIDRNLLYDYGARTSLREQWSTGHYSHFFQKMDQEMYVKVVQRALLDTVRTFLDEHGIDTTDLRARESTILNQGVIAGTVQAEVISVGAGAQASKQDAARKQREPLEFRRAA